MKFVVLAQGMLLARAEIEIARYKAWIARHLRASGDWAIGRFGHLTSGAGERATDNCFSRLHRSQVSVSSG